MAFAARLTRRLPIAVIGAVALRALVAFIGVRQAGITHAVPLFIIGAVLENAVACLLFAFTGLPAAMLLAAGSNLHVFFY